MGYTKLFHSILDSSVWQLCKESRLVWITMLAMTDREGRVIASVPGLADRAKVSLKECQEALAEFMSPDQWSRSREEDGRRIRETDGGWEIVNFKRYRDMLSREERREYNRQKQAEYRARKTSVKDSGKIAGARKAMKEGFKEWDSKG